MFRSLHFYERRNREIVFCGGLYQRIFRISTTTFSYAGSVSPALYMWAARVRGSATLNTYKEFAHTKSENIAWFRFREVSFSPTFAAVLSKWQVYAIVAHCKSHRMH